MIINANFKGTVKLDMENPSRSGVQMHIKHKKGWRPLFELTAQDIINLLTKKRKIK